MRDLWSDLRYALRMYAKTPLITAVMAVALALGIGVNSSSFIAIESIILHPLPYPNLERIVAVQGATRSQPGDRLPLTPADYLDLHSRLHTFGAIAAYQPHGITYSGADESQRLRAANVTPQFFSVLGLQPISGRTFSDAPELGNHARVAVVSEGFAKSHLSAGTPVGSVIRLNGERVTVIGVMPDRFDWPLATDVWLPLEIDAATRADRTSQSFAVLGLLRPGVSLSSAAAELDLSARRLTQQYPQTDADRLLLVSRLRELGDEHVTDRFVLLLMAASCFVLLLACANVGNLQLARAATREREIAVRSALGASRIRLMRQIAVECVLLSVVSGFLGLALASWRNDLTRATIPAAAFRYVPGLRTMHVDARVAIFCLAVSVLAGFICVVPALITLFRKQEGEAANESLRGRSTANSVPSRSRIRGTLIVFELALSLVLLVGAGLMVKTFDRLTHRDRGYDAANVLQLKVGIPATSSPTRSKTVSYYDAALSSLDSLPGARSAALLNESGVAATFEIEGRPAPRPSEPRPDVSSISQNYFKTLRIPLLAGRSVASSDTADRPSVAVISHSMAQYYWPQADPVGHRIRLDTHSGWVTIVGVAHDVVDDWFTGVPSKDVYLPYAQSIENSATFIIKTAVDPAQVSRRAQQLLLQQDPAAPPYDVKTLQQAADDDRTGVRVAEESMTLYAVIALLLALTGIYAVVSYFVAARTHDIGVRIALGAGRGDVLALVMKQSLLLTGLGLAIGIPMSMLMARAMTHALYDVVPQAPGTFLAFSAVLAASSLVASYLPTRRALRIDPMTALRNE